MRDLVIAILVSAILVIGVAYSNHNTYTRQHTTISARP